MGQITRASAKRQLQQSGRYPAEGRIELRQAALSRPDVIGVVHLEDVARAGAHAARIIDRLAVREGAQNRNASVQALFQPGVERVVVGVGLVVRILDEAKLRKRPVVACASWSRNRNVDAVLSAQFVRL